MYEEFSRHKFHDFVRNNFVHKSATGRQTNENGILVSRQIKMISVTAQEVKSPGILWYTSII